jgi:hypothetical protein
MKLKVYKDVFYADGCDLAAAIEKDAQEKKQNIKRICEKTQKPAPSHAEMVYNKTTADYERMYSQEDREWFWQWQKQALKTFKASAKAPVPA